MYVFAIYFVFSMFQNRFCIIIKILYIYIYIIKIKSLNNNQLQIYNFNNIHNNRIRYIILLIGLPASHTHTQIIGGNNAPDGLYPYQVSLRNSKNNMHFCGGAIISKNFIITAAHCLNQYVYSYHFFLSGSKYLIT